MNVFVLNTGRCGSTTWIKACRHIANYSSAHESRVRLLGAQRLAYARNHIEADNRLSWFLGRLDQAYGDRAFYVHLSREPQATARSFARRSGFGIIQAYREGILLGADPEYRDEAVAADYLATVESNIALFLKNKPRKMSARLETAKRDFERFWREIGAEGDLRSALAEFDVRYNQSDANAAL